ncbi:MAG TPA: hypothetical protein VJ476_12280, partial [Rhizomicrobium sp.]|nr:hypothetical protein [Rhizomicrobium sp.]
AAGTTGGAGGGDPTAGIAGIQFMGGPQAVVERAHQLHEAGVGILDVAVIGTGAKRAMKIFGERLAEPLHAIG